MKKTNIFLLGALVVVAVVVAVEFAVDMSGVVPYRKCSEVYKQYSKVEGVRATYVKDYRVNDTLTVGVTLLEATDNAGWTYLTKSFNISDEVLQYAETHQNFVMSENLVLRGSPETRVAIKGEDCTPNLTLDDVELLAINYRDKEFCIFHTRNAMEVMAVRSYDYKKMITN